MKENCIEIKGNSIKGNLDILFYENDGAIIAYAPSLDLMGYGINEEEAKSSFEVVLSNFFHKCLQEGTLDKCLNVIQTHISPIPEMIVRSNLKTMGVTRSEFLEVLNRIK